MPTADTEVIEASDACFICLAGAPVAVLEGLPLCGRCLEAAHHREVVDFSPPRFDVSARFKRSLVAAGFELSEVFFDEGRS